MSPASIEHHLTFWKNMADGLGGGKPLLTALRETRSALAGSPLGEAMDSLIRALTSGETLWKAMSRQPDFFSPAMQTMTRAGEVGGVLDVIARRVGKCLEEGTFSAPGNPLPQPPDAVRFWRTFGWLLASGVPIIETFEIVRGELTDETWRAAARSLQSAVLAGKSLAEAMRAAPDVFPTEVTTAVELGETTRDLDVQALRIADALQKGDLAMLPPDSAAVKAAIQKAREETEPYRIVNQTLLRAMRDHASDIHLDPLANDSGRVRLRVDGVLHDADPVSAGLFPAIVARIKIMANLDHNEHQRPQLGRIQLVIAGKEYDFRVSVAPVIGGERVVIRLLHREALSTGLGEIGLAEDDLRVVRELCRSPHGLVICTGPTGSGKTTLLYALLTEVNRDKSCVVSVEDPVEYRLEGVAQIAVRPGIGVTFPQALRAAMSQDPDVIMIGEIRDLETMEAALTCATTGHLVLTQFHAPTADGAVQCMLDVGVQPSMVNSALRGVIAQRLVRELCPQCKTHLPPQDASLPPDVVAFVRQSQDTTFYGPKGCPTCGNTGFRGRTAIHEILIPDAPFRRAVCCVGASRDLRAAALASGMKPMLIAGLCKAAQGVTSIEEVCRVAGQGMAE